MAANDELPRNWDVFEASAAGIVAVIVIAAVPGVSHVLTAVNAQFVNTGAGVAAEAVVEVLTDTSYVIGYVAGTGGGNDVENVNWTGTIVAPVNTALEVTWASNLAGWIQTIEAQGYDV